VLQPQQLLRSFFDEDFYGVLVGQPIAAGDGVVGVLVEAVVGADDSGGSSFGGDRVATHGVDFGNHRDTEVGIGFGDGDGGSQPGSATPDQENIVRGDVQHIDWI
jgi:hypothetical protein